MVEERPESGGPATREGIEKFFFIYLKSILILILTVWDSEIALSIRLSQDNYSQYESDGQDDILHIIPHNREIRELEIGGSL